MPQKIKCKLCKRDYDPESEFIEDCEMWEALNYLADLMNDYCPDCETELEERIKEVVWLWKSGYDD